jgi:hypothetical protein
VVRLGHLRSGHRSFPFRRAALPIRAALQSRLSHQCRQIEQDFSRKAARSQRVFLCVFASLREILIPGH